MESQRQILRRSDNFVFWYKIIGALTFSSIVLFYFWIADSSAGQFVRIFMFTICAFFTMVGNVAAGQEFEDWSTDVLEVLLTVKWYQWDETNKKTYLVLLTNALKPFKLKYSENMSLNYEFGVQLSKAFFSAISVLYKLQSHEKDQ